MIPFDNTYARLPDRFYARQSPVPVRNPQILAVNVPLAREMGIDPADLTADVLGGNTVPAGADPIALAYSGHQFGQFNPHLGDGRAVLLGEVDGRDVQLKGSGRTPFSRRGDGRAWLGPVLREYIMSEAMHALGIPTTRALAAVTTGEDILREGPRPGAVFTRIAASHIRVGTFEHFASRGDIDGLRSLTNYTIARHYPHADGPAALLQAVTDAQARLVAQWMAVGFIHGVMNTDNCAISGETIDYGPCAMMDDYHPKRVFSSIDRMGRYAYGNQPRVALWNLSQFASALIPLMPDEDTAVDDFTNIINSFSDTFQAEKRTRFAAKIGLTTATPDDDALLDDLLQIMAEERADFTNTFATLRNPTTLDTPPGHAWRKRWQARQPNSAVMAMANPVVIPRLHLIQGVIDAAVHGDMAPFATLLDAVTTPFAPRADGDPLTQPPRPEQVVPKTYCGT